MSVKYSCFQELYFTYIKKKILVASELRYCSFCKRLKRKQMNLALSILWLQNYLLKTVDISFKIVKENDLFTESFFDYYLKKS